MRVAPADAFKARELLGEHMEADTGDWDWHDHPLAPRFDGLEAAIAAAPSETLADLVAKARLLLEWVHDDKGDPDGEKAEAFEAKLAASLLRDLKRWSATAGPDGIPLPEPD